VLAVVLGAAGCSSNLEADERLIADPVTAPTTPASSPTAPAPTGSSVATPAGPAQQRADAANKALADALAGYTAAGAAVEAGLALREPRQALADAVGDARVALGATRQAAWGTPRNCGRVFSNSAAVRAAAGRAGAARSSVLAGTAKARTSLARMDAAQKQVGTRLAALKAALKAAPNAQYAAVAAQVDQALAAAPTKRREYSTAIAEAEARANDGAATAADLRNTAATVAGKVC
jgi:hypothetical protein